MIISHPEDQSNYLFFFFFSIFGRTPRHVRDSTCAPTIGRWRHNHRTTKEAPRAVFLRSCPLQQATPCRLPNYGLAPVTPVSPLGLTGFVSPAPRFVALPLSRWLGVRNQIRRPADPNATLEKHYLMKGREPTEVRSPTLSSIPVGLLGCPGGSSGRGARKPPPPTP